MTTPAAVPELSYRAFVPEQASGRPPLVCVHGLSRSWNGLFRAFVPAAVQQSVPLVVPLFDAASFRGYQVLGGAGGPLAAARALVSLLGTVASTHGFDTSTVNLMGFSGGGQFAHRFAMVEPARVNRLVVASAGWFTMLDTSRPFPSGTGPSAALAGARVRERDFLSLPMHVLVGDGDVQRDPALRTGRALDREQGRDRLARALTWMDHLDTVAAELEDLPEISFDVLPDTGHSFSQAVARGGLVQRTMAFLYQLQGATTSGSVIRSRGGRRDP